MNSIRNRLDKILLKAEVAFKIDARYVFSGSFWMFIGQAIATGSSFFLALAFAHFLSKDTYGNYKFVFSVVSILSAITLSGLSTVVTQTAARNQDGFLRRAFLLNIKWSSIFTAAGILVAGYYYWNGNHLLAISLVIAALLAPFFTSANFYDPFLIGKKAFKASALLDGLSVIIPAIALIISMVFIKDYVFLIFVYYVSNVFVNLAIYGYVSRTYKKNDAVDASSTSYSKHLSLMNIFSAVAGNLDQILVFHFLGAASLAIYAFAIAMPEMIKGLFKNIGSLAMPRFSERTVQEIQATVWKKIILFGSAAALAILVYIIVSPLIFKYLFSQYIVSLPYSQIYALSLLSTANVIPTTALQAHSAKKELYQSTIYSSVFQILIVFLLIYFYGLWGAVIARIVTRMVSFFISILLLNSFIKPGPINHVV